MTAEGVTLDPSENPDLKDAKKPHFMDRTQIEKLGPGEMFIDVGGTPGYATTYNGHITVRDAHEWEVYEPGAMKLIKEKAAELSQFYHLPGRPDIEGEDSELMTAIIRIVHPIIEFPSRCDTRRGVDDGEDSRYESVFAAWNIASYLRSYFCINPRLMVRGPTEVGKTRVGMMASLLGYHGAAIGSPTSAVMFRLSGWYGATVSMDEIQDLGKDRLMDILDIYKLGFDKTPVARMDGDNKNIQMFPTDAYLVVSSKNYDFPEDVFNRGIEIVMSKHVRPVTSNTPQDCPEFELMRGRLLALKLKAQAGQFDMDAIIEKAADLSREPIVMDGVEHRLTDRAREITEVLIAAALAGGGDDENIEDIKMVMLANVLESTEALRETPEGRAFLALQHLLENKFKGHPERITTKMVKEQLNTDLIQSGDSGKWEVKTKTVTKDLHSLGFKFKEGAGRASFFDPKYFQAAYTRNLSKYGVRDDSEDF